MTRYHTDSIPEFVALAAPVLEEADGEATVEFTTADPPDIAALSAALAEYGWRLAEVSVGRGRRRRLIGKRWWVTVATYEKGE